MLAGDRDGLQAAVAGHGVHERPGRGEQVRAVVDPVVAARVRAQPAAEPSSASSSSTSRWRSRHAADKPGDASADDDDVACAHAGMIRARRYPS